MEYREYTGKTVEDAVMEAAIQLETSSDKLNMKFWIKEAAVFWESEADLRRSVPAKFWTEKEE